jgi:hypothetical protein
LLLGQAAEIEPLQRDIDAENCRRRGCHRESLPCKFELAWSAAHATVRVPRQSLVAIKLHTVFRDTGLQRHRSSETQVFRDQGYDDLPPGRIGAAAQQPQCSFKQSLNITEQRDSEKIQGYASA